VIVVDSSGWLEYFANGPGADAFAAAFETPEELIVPTVTIYEVHKRVAQQRGADEATQAIALMQQGRVIDLSVHLALAASRVSRAHGLPMADAIILATAREHDATLWTQDADFAGIEGVRYVAKA
jgi:predicted nucleic acid-binding protein